MVYLCDQLICAVAFVNADTYWDEGRVHVHFVVCIPDLQLCLQRCCVLLIAYFPTFDMDNLFGSSCDDSCLSSHWGLIWVYNRYWVGTYEEMFLLRMGGRIISGDQGLMRSLNGVTELCKRLYSCIWCCRIVLQLLFSSDSGIMVMIVSAAVLAIKRCLLLQYGPIRSGFMMMRM